MKRVILALAGAFIVTTNAFAAEPYSFGIKVGGMNNNLTNFAKKLTDQKDEYLNPAIAASLYGEYAFHEMVGAELEAGYIFGKVDGYKATTNGDKNYRSLNVQMMKTSLGLKIYPMGREDKEDIGILSARIGGDLYVPFSAEWSGKTSGNDLSADDKKINKEDELNSIGIGAGLVIGYEFPFGLLAELNGGMVFTDFFKEDSNIKTGTLNLTKDVKNNLWNWGLAVGYNIATLMEE